MGLTTAMRDYSTRQREERHQPDVFMLRIAMVITLSLCRKLY